MPDLEAGWFHARFRGFCLPLEDFPCNWRMQGASPPSSFKVTDLCLTSMLHDKPLSMRYLRVTLSLYLSNSIILDCADTAHLSVASICIRSRSSAPDSKDLHLQQLFPC